MSALQLSRETGVRQQNLSRWLTTARSLPLVATDQSNIREWTVAEKARVLADASNLTGEELTAHLEREGVKLAEFEQWRVALEEGGTASTAAARRIRKLERELTRKEKALMPTVLFGVARLDTLDVDAEPQPPRCPS